jgi:transcriptional regulator with XRE-family HTH domain
VEAMKSKEFGKYLKTLRESLKLTLLDVEKQAKISNGYLSQIESGERGIPHFDTMKKLSLVYKVRIDELMAKAELSKEGHIPDEQELKFLSRGYEKLSSGQKQELKSFLGYLLEKKKK